MPPSHEKDNRLLKPIRQLLTFWKDDQWEVDALRDVIRTKPGSEQDLLVGNLKRLLTEADKDAKITRSHKMRKPDLVAAYLEYIHAEKLPFSSCSVKIK